MSETVPSDFFAGLIIVVADDNSSHRDLTIHGLKRYGGEVSNIHEAANGAEAVALIASVQPDLILLDGLMPGGMSGYDVAVTALAQGLSPEVPVILITSQGSDLRDQAVKAGFWFQLVKPVTPRELGPRIHQLIPNIPKR